MVATVNKPHRPPDRTSFLWHTRHNEDLKLLSVRGTISSDEDDDDNFVDPVAVTPTLLPTNNKRKSPSPPLVDEQEEEEPPKKIPRTSWPVSAPEKLADTGGLIVNYGNLNFYGSMASAADTEQQQQQ